VFRFRHAASLSLSFQFEKTVPPQIFIINKQKVKACLLLQPKNNKRWNSAHFKFGVDCRFDKKYIEHIQVKRAAANRGASALSLLLVEDPPQAWMGEESHYYPSPP
jgi:hypothetical protein